MPTPKELDLIANDSFLTYALSAGFSIITLLSMGMLWFLKRFVARTDTKLDQNTARLRGLDTEMTSAKEKINQLNQIQHAQASLHRDEMQQHREETKRQIKTMRDELQAGLRNVDIRLAESNQISKQILSAILHQGDSRN